MTSGDFAGRRWHPTWHVVTHERHFEMRAVSPHRANIAHPQIPAHDTGVGLP
jgi:hypothetical protein